MYQRNQGQGGEQARSPEDGPRPSGLRAATVAWAVFALVAVQLLSWALPLNPFSDPALLEVQGPTLDALRAPSPDGLPFRVSATSGPGMRSFFGTLFPPNSLLIHGMEDARGYATCFPWLYKRLLRAAEHTKGGSRVSLLHRRFDSWVFDLLNVRRVASQAPLDGPGLRELLGPPASKVQVYENESAFPRAFFAWEVERMDEEAFLATARDPRGSRPPHRMILPPGVEGVPSLGGPPSTAELRWLDAGAQGLRIEVALDREAYLVVLERGDPGWSAWVDEEPARILPAFHIFRAIRVKAGRHEVVFRYRPLPFYLGLGISVLALAAILVLGGLLWPR